MFINIYYLKNKHSELDSIGYLIIVNIDHEIYYLLRVGYPLFILLPEIG